jgi:hypothetical protein
MTARHLRLILPAVLLGVAALSARADSLAASSAAGGSSASSASSASSDKSSDKSSDSSSKNTKVAAGPYRIVDLAAVPQRPGTLRVRLQALAGAAQEEDVVLFLPQQAIERSRLTMGQTVIANKRPYGTEFAVADTAFFLLLNDDWFGELAANPVVL